MTQDSPVALILGFAWGWMVGKALCELVIWLWYRWNTR